MPILNQAVPVFLWQRMRSLAPMLPHPACRRPLMMSLLAGSLACPSARHHAMHHGARMS